jgi:hypothetical protein
MTKQEVIEKINEVLTNFLEQEAGNKISQYNMQGLLTTMMAAVESIPDVGKEVVKSEKKKD